MPATMMVASRTKATPMGYSFDFMTSSSGPLLGTVLPFGTRVAGTLTGPGG